MQTITFMKHKSELQFLFNKIQDSINDINKNHPTRLDLINSMSDSLLKLGDAIEFYRSVEFELKVQDKRNFDLEHINLILIAENNELKNTNKSLIDRVEL